MTKSNSETDLDFVRRLAAAIAVANGHSHPEDYADKVAEAYQAPAAESDSEESDDDADAGSGGEG